MKDSSVLVNINKNRSATADQQSGMSRRKFLKVIGAASAAGVAGCADSAQQNVFPHVRGQVEQVPGVAVWYSSTCGECPAGCGIRIRTREGRAVKIEGNPDHPISQGGLCALGQSALQHHYDPDRIRQPLARGPQVGSPFQPISWQDAYARIANAMRNSEKKKAILTGHVSGAEEELVSSFSASCEAEHVVYDLMEQSVIAQAAELVYGVKGLPNYKLSEADVIVNFGADFLETWISPVEYARGWSDARRKKLPAKVIHVEPRLSLTGANADLWLSARPGTEMKVLLLLIKLIIEGGRGDITAQLRTRLEALTSSVSLDVVASESGVSRSRLLSVARYLSEANAPLVLGGGAAGSTSNALSFQVAINLLNLALGAPGKTIDLSALRQPRSSVAELELLIKSMQNDEVGLLFMAGSNPAFTLPASYAFRFAVPRVSIGGLVVSLSSHLDETAQLADIILPLNTGIESWGDSRERSGIYGLRQPAMTPLFDTRDLGDILLQIASAAGLEKVSGGAQNFREYLRASWRKLHSEQGIEGDFERFWLESLERGGFFAGKAKSQPATRAPSNDVFNLDFGVAQFAASDERDDLVLFPYFSVRSFDGRAANRPWMQELPDPITKVVWDSWAEMHPDTASARGISSGDMVTVRNFFGEINVPVYITEYVHRDIVAVPIGQGHQAYGRFARQLKEAGNVLELVSNSAAETGAFLPLVATKARVIRGRRAADLVTTQKENSQHGRHLAETKFLNPDGSPKPKKEHGAHHPEDPKQMYLQRVHPLYSWGMTVDLAACTGCSACVVACYAENNIAVVGKKVAAQGRHMAWLRIDRYYEGTPEELHVDFQPMTCQHCNNAPCEPVCPVYATYHNEEGLNAMIYNRCVGTRYCSNNCSYKVRRFNWFEYEFPETLELQLNPDVTRRTVGVMEKCTFCVQRIAEAKDRAKDLGRPVLDGEVQPACVQSCPTKALTFGNRNDPQSNVSRLAASDRAYKVLDDHINTQPAISYLEGIKYKL